MELFLDQLVRLNAQTDGRDKIARFDFEFKNWKIFVSRHYVEFQTDSVFVSRGLGLIGPKWQEC